MIFAKAIWVFWLVGILVFGLVVVRVESLQFRLCLLRMWWDRNGGHEVQSLKVPYNDVDKLKIETLEQMDDDKKTFAVQFATECPFNLDQCDAGGLSREWATLFAKGITQQSKHPMWPFFRKWDSESDVFHLNLEARSVEQMKLWKSLADRAVSEDFQDAVSEDFQDEFELREVWKSLADRAVSEDFQDAVSEDFQDAVSEDFQDEFELREDEQVLSLFYQLGVVIAKCFLRNLQLVPLSTALIKFVIRSDNDSDSKYSITYADFEELFPCMAKHMRTSPEDSPFDEISLVAEFLEEEMKIQTGFQDGDFNPAKQPSEKKWDSLAVKIVENEHVLPLLEYFKKGFRKVIDMNLGELFSVAELQQIMTGRASIDLGDWRKHTKYEKCSACHPVIKTFWSEMGRLSQQQLQMVCKFVTGLQTPPMKGFSELVPRFTLKTCAVKVMIAHTCSNTLDLPEAMDLSMMNIALCEIE